MLLIKKEIKDTLTKVFGGTLDAFFTTDGTPYFPLNEIAGMLGFANPTDALKTHVDWPGSEKESIRLYQKDAEGDAKLLWTSKTDKMPKTLISKPAFFAMVSGSKLEKAKDFKAWIYTVVLPSIDEIGGYIAGQEDLTVEQNERLKPEIAALHDEVTALREENARQKDTIVVLEKKEARLQKRRHELISDLKSAKADKKMYKKQAKAWKEDSLSQQAFTQKLLDENTQMFSQLHPVKIEIHPDPVTETVVDANGMVIKISNRSYNKAERIS